jgi:hypothetical protein
VLVDWNYLNSELGKLVKVRGDFYIKIKFGVAHRIGSRKL